MAPRGLRRADCPLAAPPARADGDLSPRHPRGQPRPQATQGRTGPVGSVAPHHARPHPRRRCGSSATEAPRAAQPAGRQIDLFLILLVLGAIGVGVVDLHGLLGRHPGARRQRRDRRRAGPHPRGRRGARHPHHARAAPTSCSAPTSRSTACSVLEDLEPEADGRTLRIRPADLVESELVEQALAEGEHRSSCRWAACSSATPPSRGATSSTASPPTLDVPASLDRRCRSTSPVTDRGRRWRRASSCASATSRIDNDDGSLRGRLRHAAHRVARVRGRSTKPATARPQHVVVPGRSTRTARAPCT